MRVAAPCPMAARVRGTCGRSNLSSGRVLQSTDLCVYGITHDQPQMRRCMHSRCEPRPPPPRGTLRTVASFFRLMWWNLTGEFKNMDGEAPTDDHAPSRLIQHARDQIALLERLAASTGEAARRSRALLDELERRHGQPPDNDRWGLEGRLA